MFQLPIPARSSRLKRRVGTLTSSVANTETMDIDDTAETKKEPPLKKFKALFDASYPDSIPELQNNEWNPSESQNFTPTISQTQSSITLGTGASSGDLRLGVVAEEEEESPIARNEERGAKRKLRSDAMDGGDELNEAIGNLDMPGPAKRRAIETTNGTAPNNGENYKASHTPSGSERPKLPLSQSGATAGKPDVDLAFLKAVASTKKGKKTEDSFDREFNKLKISKPDIRHENQEEEWAVLDDFEQDRGIRGNFMVVLEMNIHAKSARQQNEARREWRERPNFKKFKKVDIFIQIQTYCLTPLCIFKETPHKHKNKSGSCYSRRK